MKRKISWFGIVLVLLGVALLLERTGVLAFGWSVLFWAVVALAGLSKLVYSYPRKLGGGVFWGTVFFLFGAFEVLMDLDVISFGPPFAFPILALIAGLGFAAMYSVSPRRWHVLLAAVFLTGLGAFLTLTEAGIVNSPGIEYALKGYWPVALILFGALLLLNRREA